MSQQQSAPARTTQRRVVALVVTWNSEAVLGACLDALPAAMTGVGGYRVLVVDNASSDGTIALASSRADVTIVRTGRNAGYGAAINAGCRRLEDDEAVLVLNPDVRLEPGSVAAMLRTAERTGAGIVVPRLVDAAGRPQPSLRREPTAARAWGEAVLGGPRASSYERWGEVVPLGAAYEQESAVDWATGCALLVSSHCRQALGDWPEEWFLYSEETEYMLRARDAGLAVHLSPDAVARHAGGESTTSPALWALLTRNRAELHRRRHGTARGLAFRAGLFVGESVRAVVRRGPARRVHAAAVRGLLLTDPARLRAEAGQQSAAATTAVLGGT